MFRIIGTAVVCLLVTFSTASAAPNVPTRGQIKGSVVKMGQQFHLVGYNYRIVKIRWVAADSAFARTLKNAEGVQADAPMGLLVFKTSTKNTLNDENSAPYLIVTAIYKDGTQVDGYETPLSSSGVVQASRKIYPGQGATFYYAVAGVPKPTAANPLTKLILSNGSNNDPGYPRVYRLIDPVVSP